MKVCDPPVWASFFDQQFPPKNTGELDIISVNWTKRVGVFCHILRKNQSKTPQGMRFLFLAFPKNQVPGRRLRTLFLRKVQNMAGIKKSRFF